MAVDGDFAVVGAPGRAESYVFWWNGAAWVEVQKLAPPPEEFNYLSFGWSVDIHAGVIVIGVVDGIHQFTPSNKAFVFEWTGSIWEPRPALVPQISNWDFGFAVATDGEVVAVAAPLPERVHVFRSDGTRWNEEVQFDGPASSRFGQSLGVLGDVLFVGIPLDDDAGAHAGAVQVFRRVDGIWIPTQKLTASDATSDAEFGSSIDADGNTLVGGAPGAVAVYVFRLGPHGWVETHKIRPSNTGLGGVYLFGARVSLDQEHIVGSAFNGSLGVVYLFDISVCSVAIPAVSSIGVILLACLLLVSACVLIARRSNPVSGTSAAVGSGKRASRWRLRPQRGGRLFLRCVACFCVYDVYARAQELRPRQPVFASTALEKPNVPYRLVVKFRDEFRARSDNGVLVSSAGLDMARPSALGVANDVVFRPLIDLPEQTLADLEGWAAALSGETQPDLAGMMEVLAPDATIEQLANQLAKLDEVEWVQFSPLEMVRWNQWGGSDGRGGGGGPPILCEDYS